MTTSLAGLTDCIAPQLAAVDELFQRETAQRSFLRQPPCETRTALPGEDASPALTLLAGRACGELTASHVVIATVVEMVHMATLVHDDVLDEAELRRRGARPSTTSVATRRPSCSAII